MNATLRLALTAEVIVFVLLAALVVTGLVPSADIVYAVSGALVSAVFTIPRGLSGIEGAMSRKTPSSTQKLREGLTIQTLNQSFLTSRHLRRRT